MDITGTEVLHQRNTESPLDEQPIRVLDVGNIDQVGQATTLIDHREMHPIGQHPDGDADPTVRRHSLVGLDRVRDGLGGDPPQIVQTVTIENVGRRCRCSDNHSHHRDEVRAGGNVDLHGGASGSVELPAG